MSDEKRLVDLGVRIDAAIMRHGITKDDLARARLYNRLQRIYPHKPTIEEFAMAAHRLAQAASRRLNQCKRPA